MTLHVVFILVRVMRSHADRPTFRRPSVVLCSLLVLQLMLGLASYFAKFTSALGLPMGALVVLTTTHLITGSLMLATSLLLTLRAYRYSVSSKLTGGRRVLTEQFSS